MVEIWRWPKASLSVSSTACMRHAEAARLLAVDLDEQRAGRRPASRGDIAQGRHRPQALDELRPSRRLRGVGSGQRVLILRAALPGRDLDVLNRRDEDGRRQAASPTARCQPLERLRDARSVRSSRAAG